MTVAEPRCLVCCHRLDHLLVQGTLGRAAESGDEPVETILPAGPDDRQQAGLDEVLLPGLEGDRRAAMDELADVGEVGRGDAHELAPAPSRELGEAPSRARRSALTRSAAIAGSGRIRSARPAVATAPGIPQTIEVASSWTTISAPAARSRSLPRSPSCPMPVRTQASTYPLKTAAAVRKSTSTAGRHPFCRASWLVATRGTPRSSTTRRWASPGAITTRPGSRRMPGWPSTTVSLASLSSRCANTRVKVGGMCWTMTT